VGKPDDLIGKSRGITGQYRVIVGLMRDCFKKSKKTGSSGPAKGGASEKRKGVAKQVKKENHQGGKKEGVFPKGKKDGGGKVVDQENALGEYRDGGLKTNKMNRRKEKPRYGRTKKPCSLHGEKQKTEREKNWEKEKK